MFYNTYQIKELARDCGNHFFDPGSTRFFQSRTHERVYGGRYFVTSEQHDGPEVWGGARRYTIRSFDYTEGVVTIDTVGDFGFYETSADAHRAAAKLAEAKV